MSTSDLARRINATSDLAIKLKHFGASIEKMRAHQDVLLDARDNDEFHIEPWDRHGPLFAPASTDNKYPAQRKTIQVVTRSDTRADFVECASPERALELSIKWNEEIIAETEAIYARLEHELITAFAEVRS